MGDRAVGDWILGDWAVGDLGAAGISSGACIPVAALFEMRTRPCVWGWGVCWEPVDAPRMRALPGCSAACPANAVLLTKLTQWTTQPTLHGPALQVTDWEEGGRTAPHHLARIFDKEKEDGERRVLVVMRRVGACC